MLKSLEVMLKNLKGLALATTMLIPSAGLVSAQATNSEALSDQRVRQAIAYAIDMDTIVETLFEGKAIAADSMLPNGPFKPIRTNSALRISSFRNTGTRNWTLFLSIISNSLYMRAISLIGMAVAMVTNSTIMMLALLIGQWNPTQTANRLCEQIQRLRNSSNFHGQIWVFGSPRKLSLINC